jgi:hypothetical protein
MPLPEKALFKKICNLNIAGKLFTYPPFSIEFEQTFSADKPSVTKAKLYNPNRDTIKAAEGKIRGQTKEYPSIQIEAGFEDDYGTVCVGEVNDYKIITQGVDIILELTVGDMTGAWSNMMIGESYKNMGGDAIAKDIMKKSGINANVVMGEIKKFRTFSASSFKDALQKLTKETKSTFYIKNGTLFIEPKNPTGKKSVAYISPTSGLKGGIEKDAKGYKFKTLFMYKIGMSDVVQIEDKFYSKTNVRVIEGKKVFSTFGNAECEYLAAQA